jgi:glycerophosphoryl diester phosphodiesterase
MLGAPFAASALRAQTTCTSSYALPRWNVNAMHQQLLHPASGLVLVAAHRGLWRDTPENSETGIRNAFARWEMLETDLRKTSDWQTVGDLAVTHDADITRTTDGTGYLFNTTMAQLMQCRLLDRYGAVYNGGSCYPSNSSGAPANDATTGIGRRVMKFSQLLSVQQDFLSGTDSQPYGPIIVMDVKAAVGDDPGHGTPGDGIFDTMNVALDNILHSQITLKQRRSLVFMVKFNKVLGRANFETYVQAYATYDPVTKPLPRIMLIFNPEDGASLTPDQNADFQSWLNCPYLSHFEMNQYYFGDGCQAYIDYLQQPLRNIGISTYSENPFFPEGVWDNTRFVMRNIDFSIFPVDFRELPDYTIANKLVGLVTSERPAETDALLRQYGLRNVPVQ